MDNSSLRSFTFEESLRTWLINYHSSQGLLDPGHDVVMDVYFPTFYSGGENGITISYMLVYGSGHREEANLAVRDVARGINDFVDMVITGAGAIISEDPRRII